MMSAPSCVSTTSGADLDDSPHGAACWGCGDETVDWKLAAQTAGNAIHEIAPDWLVFVAGVERPDGELCDPDGSEPCTWWGANLELALDNPVELDQANKVVYSPTEFGLSGFEHPWFAEPDFPSNMPPLWDRWWGNIATADAAPVVVGSLGARLESENDSAWLTAALDYVDTAGVGFVYSALNPNSANTGGILNDDWNTVDEAQMDLLRPYLDGPFT